MILSYPRISWVAGLIYTRTEDTNKKHRTVAEKIESEPQFSYLCIESFSYRLDDISVVSAISIANF
jgi:hypothetical protein